jgi:hypothetical protein
VTKKSGNAHLKSCSDGAEAFLQLAADVRAVGERLEGGADQKVLQALSPANNVMVSKDFRRKLRKMAILTQFFTEKMVISLVYKKTTILEQNR